MGGALARTRLKTPRLWPRAHGNLLPRNGVTLPALPLWWGARRAGTPGKNPDGPAGRAGGRNLLPTIPAADAGTVGRSGNIDPQDCSGCLVGGIEHAQTGAG